MYDLDKIIEEMRKSEWTPKGTNWVDRLLNNMAKRPLVEEKKINTFYRKMKAIKLPNNTMPVNTGEYSVQDKMYRPPYGEREEVFMKTPTGHTGALIPEHHTWSFNEDGEITVSPSIIYFEYHGMLINDVWST